MLKEFREFAMRGSVIDMAVGIIIGAAFGALVNSMVSDVLMPPFGLILGGVDFSNMYILLEAGSPPGPYYSLLDAAEAGAVTINYGQFINVVISFAVMAFALFILVKAINRLKREQKEPAAPNTKDCPHCLMTIPIKATRCGYCTSSL